MRYPDSSLLKNIYWFPFNEEAMVVSLSSPSFLLPDESPDSLWHLFCHSRLGVVHLKSTSGLAWGKGSLVRPLGRTPSLYREGNTYHMIYTERKLRSGSDVVLLSSSVDLERWSRPFELLSSDKVPLASWRGGKARVMHPQLVSWKGKYRLYFGAGDENSWGASLPARLMAADSYYLEGPYDVRNEVFFPPEPWGEPPILASGPVRMTTCSDALAAFQAAACYDESEGRVYSSLLLYFSSDGLFWQRAGKIQESTATGWASGLMTGAEARWKENERTWYCFYSAVDRSSRPLKSSIGLLLGQRSRPIS